MKSPVLLETAFCSPQDGADDGSYRETSVCCETLKSFLFLFLSIKKSLTKKMALLGTEKRWQECRVILGDERLGKHESLSRCLFLLFFCIFFRSLDIARSDSRPLCCRIVILFTKDLCQCKKEMRDEEILPLGNMKEGGWIYRRVQSRCARSLTNVQGHVESQCSF